MTFQIRALDPEPFTALFSMSDTELAKRGACRVTADAAPGYPCRVSLQDAGLGEELILTHYRHLDTASPYAASHAIYVRKNAEKAEPAPGEIPAVLAARLLSVRAFDAHGFMRDADVIDGQTLGEKLNAMFADAGTAFIDIHNAKPGCFAARAIRAG